METRNLERIRFVTRHFNDLQGLRYAVPLGLLTLAWGGAGLLCGALLLGAFLLFLGARRYYRRTFGEVEQRSPDLAAELSPVFVYGPAGAVSRIEGFRQVTPIARHFLLTLVLALALFSYFQAIPPNFVVEGDASLGQHPRVVQERHPYIGPPVIKVLDGRAVRAPSMRKAVFGQTIYVLYGSVFLGFWLWRGRHPSQSHHLAFAVLFLGLSALGTSLGYIARPGGEIAPLIDSVLPALVYPGLAVLLCGSSMVLAGFLDHWHIVRALGGAVAQGEED